MGEEFAESLVGEVDWRYPRGGRSMGEIEPLLGLTATDASLVALVKGFVRDDKMAADRVDKVRASEREE
jgi:hypothetical protein